MIRKKSPEFLLQLTDKSGLDLVEILQLTERNEDDDGLAAAIKLELLGSGDVQIVKIGFQLSGRHLQTSNKITCMQDFYKKTKHHLKVGELLGNRCLELVGFGTAGFDNLGTRHNSRMQDNTALKNTQTAKNKTSEIRTFKACNVIETKVH